MANRRMFSKELIDSDKFTDMPLSTQALYFHYGMEADDDGFVNNPRGMLRRLGCSNDELLLLATKGFIIPFETGVIVITHWKQNNYIAADRYHKTKNIKEAQALKVTSSGEYTIVDNELIDTFE